MGRILRQKSSTEHIGSIINMSRSRANFSDHMKKRNHSESHELYRFNISSSRLKNLEKNKRVRTRETEMTKFSQQYKNVVNTEPT